MAEPAVLERARVVALEAQAQPAQEQEEVAAMLQPRATVEQQEWAGAHRVAPFIAALEGYTDIRAIRPGRVEQRSPATDGPEGAQPDRQALDAAG